MNEEAMEKVGAYLREHPEERLLVVGGDVERNFSPTLLKQPRFVFWDTEGGRLKGKTEIPEGVKYVLINRFVDHSTYYSVKNLAEGTATVIGPVNTGGIRRILKAALPAEVEAPEEVSVAAHKIGRNVCKYGRGELAEWMEKVTSVERFARAPADEIRRLQALQKEQGMPVSTSHSFRSWYDRRRKGLKRPPAYAKPAAQNGGGGLAGLDLLQGLVNGMRSLQEQREYIKEAMDHLQVALEGIDRILGKGK